MVVQLAIGDLAAGRRIIALPDDGGVMGAFGQMPVDAIGAGIERAVGEPANMQVILVPGSVLDLGEGRHPVEPRRLLTPEGVRLLDRLPIHLCIAFGVHACGALVGFGDGIDDLVLGRHGRDSKLGRGLCDSLPHQTGCDRGRNHVSSRRFGIRTVSTPLRSAPLIRAAGLRPAALLPGRGCAWRRIATGRPRR